MDAATAEIADRLAGVERQFDTAVAFGGAGTGLADALLATGKVGSVHRMERHPAAYAAGASGIVADEEALPFAAESIDLFVAPLALQWTNDLPGALAQIRERSPARRPSTRGDDGRGDAVGASRRNRHGRDRAVAAGRARGSCPPPTFAIWAPCCSARVSRCRSPTGTC